GGGARARCKTCQTRQIAWLPNYLTRHLTVGLQKSVTTPPTLRVKFHASTITINLASLQLDEMVLNLTDLGRKLTAGRQKNQELSPTARTAICGAVAAGASQRAVATAFGVSHAL